MRRIIMLRGLPASGKSTWAKSQITQGGHTKRVSKDDLRAMLDNGFHTKPNEAFVLAVRDAIVIQALTQEQVIIVDDTNYNPLHEKRLREIASELEADFQVKDFSYVPLEECIRRDSERGEKSVGEKVIRDMHERYIQKSPIETVLQNPTLPDAFICDLDGTLAVIDGRSPYDASKCEGDELNLPVAAVIRFCKEGGPKLVFVSGRDEKYRPQTEAWLRRHGFEYAALFMRPTGDERKDAIVKKEIFNEKILPNFYTLFVFDDRNQVVDMWRSLGLTCFQVAPGNF